MGQNREQKDEFRYNYSTSHMNYIFEKRGRRYVGMGLTTEDETFGIKNMPLNVNPKRTGTEQAYIRNGIISGKENNYARKPDKRYAIRDAEDRQNVKSKKRNYNRHYRNKKR